MSMSLFCGIERNLMLVITGQFKTNETKFYVIEENETQ